MDLAWSPLLHCRWWCLSWSTGCVVTWSGAQQIYRHLSWHCHGCDSNCGDLRPRFSVSGKLRKPVNNLGKVLIGFFYVIFLAVPLIKLELALFSRGDNGHAIDRAQFFKSEFKISSGLTLVWFDYYWVYLSRFVASSGTTIAEPSLIAVAMARTKYLWWQYQREWSENRQALGVVDRYLAATVSLRAPIHY